MSSRLQLDVRQSLEAPSGERLWGKGEHWCNYKQKLCDASLSALRLLPNELYVNTFTFTLPYVNYYGIARFDCIKMKACC